MPSQNSFNTVAEQVILFNNNLVQTLSQINQLITSPSPSVSINITDKSGVVSQFSLPSFGFLKSEIDRLNNNINAIYNVDNSGALIQPSSSNIFQKVVTVNLNVEPNDITNLAVITNFKSDANNFFDGLVDPLLSVEFDLSNKIQNNVRKVLCRRYIVDFEQDALGNLTNLGQSALNSFNTLFRNNNYIVLSEFQNWLGTTPGVANPTLPVYSEETFELEPNQLQYDGIFSVLKTETDTINNKLWYWLDTLNYLDTSTEQIKQLAVSDELIVNQDNSTTVYTIVDISTASSSPKVSLQRSQGNMPIPIGNGTLKIYSPVFYSKKVQITIGFNERTVVFIKPLNMDNYILSKNWSLGSGFYTNDLTLNSNDSYNGFSMNQYYSTVVYDYGNVIKDLVAKKIPNTLAIKPNAPVLDINSFSVVQTNKHLTDNTNSTELKSKYNQQKSLQSEIDQINQAITDKNKQLQITRFTSDAAKQQFQNELNKLTTTRDAKTTSLNTLTQDILNLSNAAGNSVDYQFSVRGFWAMPAPAVSTGTKPQQVIQFVVQYKKLSIDGNETPITTFNVSNSSSTTGSTSSIASFSNWISLNSPVRGRTFDPATGNYTWNNVDISNPDVVNINQVDIPIEYNEQIQIRVKSISEAGWPESPGESDWSNIISIPFPDALKNNVNQTNAIITDSNKQDIKNSIQSDYNAKGLDTHLSETAVINNKTYLHNAASILSGFKDSNGIAIDLYDYLVSLQNRIVALEQQINNAKGQLQVIVFNNSDQYVVKNGSKLSFTVECEDYLDPYTAPGVPTGRVYANSIYVVRDFLLQISNVSTTSPLGLLSNRVYVNPTNTDVYNQSAPQVFWVNDQNELIFSNLTGQTKTQLDNQFIWMVNYDSINQTSITKLSDNIGNGFIGNNSNSITNVLSSTQFNLGYSENSILSFVGNNNSLLDASKWIDDTISVASTNKLLTSIHPSIKDISNLVETNSAKNHELDGGVGNSINIPIYIYFKMNALDYSQSGLNNEYINLNSANTTIKHTKEVKFFMETDVDNRPFEFSINFTINRNKVIINKVLTPVQVVKNIN